MTPRPDRDWLVNVRAKDEMLHWTERRGSLWVKRMTEDWQTPTDEELTIHRLLAALRDTAPALDVERLADAIHEHQQCDFGYCDGRADHIDQARGIAQEYDRLGSAALS